jgi:hypothetical protein
MKVSFRITRDLLAQIHTDLSRPHPFAAERVAFLSCGAAALPGGGLTVLAEEIHSVADDHYLDYPRAGATIGSAAFRTVLELAYNRPVSMFHIHRHDHHGIPRFSPLDLRESARFVPDFAKVRPGRPHGVLVLSYDALTGLCWYPGERAPVPIDTTSIVGYPTRTIQIIA